MLRIYLALIVAAAILGAFMDRTDPTTEGRAPVPATIVSNDGSGGLIDLKTRSEPQFNSQDGSIELQRNPDGHFYADVRVNGTYIHMLVDTGATTIALSRNDARMAGIATSIGMNDVVGRGADGAVHGEAVLLDSIELGPLSAHDLDAVVLNSGEQSLLGQSFLGKFSSVRIENDRMVLR